jgi:putative ABC transport system ATP-binding protein
VVIEALTQGGEAVTQSSGAAPILAVDELLFRWNSSQPPCIDIARFAVAAGERVFVYGPSGSGKSTLLGLLGGVLVPERGSVRALGADLSAMNAVERDRFRVDHIGFIFQQFNLVPYLTVLDNVLLPCRFSARRRERAGRDPRAAALQLLRAVDLASDLVERPVTQLSVGQQQRVAAARALIGRPEIIIADEPTSSLDADRQHRFLQLLLHECQASNATLLFVSHDHRLAVHFTKELALHSLNRASDTAEATV